MDRTFRSFLTPDLLILDDLGLHLLTAQQSADLYELIQNRRRASSFVITSNRAADGWLGLFEDSILDNSDLDRLANPVSVPSRLKRRDLPWMCAHAILIPLTRGLCSR